MINTILSAINGGACALISIVLIWMILSPRIHDSLIIKSGLIPMALGFGSIALMLFDGLAPSKLQGMGNGLLLINAGLSLVIIGYLWRKARLHHPVRRTTDWSDLMDNDMDTRP